MIGTLPLHRLSSRDDTRLTGLQAMTQRHPAETRRRDAPTLFLIPRMTIYQTRDSATIRATVDAADAGGDKATADRLTRTARTCDKDLWLLETHMGGR